MKSLEESKIIDFTRLLIMGGVVLVHSNISSYLGDGAESASRAAWVINFVSDNLCRVCVPMFFFISGMLFFRNWTYTFSSYKNKFKRRVNSLLIPYLLWCTIGMLLFLFKTSPMGAPFFPAYADAAASFPKIIEGFWSQDLLGIEHCPFPFDFSLWFIRNLWVCVMLVPLLRVCFKLNWWWLIIALLLSGIKFYGIAASVFYFSFGALCSINRVPVIALCRPRWVWLPALVTYIAIKLVGLIWFPGVISKTNPLLLTCGFVGLFGLAGELSFMLRYRLMQQILASLFFVYAFHALWVTVLIKTMVALVAPQGMISTFACNAGVFLIQWTVGISLFTVLQRWSPFVVSLLTGGRNTLQKATFTIS